MSTQRKISTLYGPLDECFYKEFSRVSGHKWDSEVRDWVLITDRVDHWQLLNPSSPIESKRYIKKEGFLPIRDLNFQYSILKTQKIVNGEKTTDLESAINYARIKLFSIEGQPLYLPDLLAEKNGKDSSEKHFNYNKILEVTH